MGPGPRGLQLGRERDQRDLVGGPAPENPYGIRGVGEVPIIPPLAVIGNALKNATGVRIREIPLNPERVFWALQENQ